MFSILKVSICLPCKPVQQKLEMREVSMTQLESCAEHRWNRGVLTHTYQKSSECLKLVYFLNFSFESMRVQSESSEVVLHLTKYTHVQCQRSV